MTNEKTCFICKKVKPLTEFYKHKAMGDGHLNKCKCCTKEYVKKYRISNIKEARAYDRERNKTPKRKAMFAKKQRRKRASSKDYRTSHCKLARAVKNGLVLKPDKCERCDATDNVQGHHDDHSKALDVMWLCPVCHAQRHSELGKLGKQVA